MNPVKFEKRLRRKNMAIYHMHLKDFEPGHFCAIIEGKSFKNAINLFHHEPFRATVLGRESYFYNLLYIDENKPITKLPSCKKIFAGEKECKLCCEQPKLDNDFDEGILGLCSLDPKVDHSKKWGYCPLAKILYHPCNPRFPGSPTRSTKKKIEMNGVIYTAVDLSRIKP